MFPVPLHARSGSLKPCSLGWCNLGTHLDASDGRRRPRPPRRCRSEPAWFDAPGRRGHPRPQLVRHEGLPDEPSTGVPSIVICNRLSRILPPCNAHFRRWPTTSSAACGVGSCFHREFPRHEPGQSLCRLDDLFANNRPRWTSRSPIRRQPDRRRRLLACCDRRRPPTAHGAPACDLPTSCSRAAPV